MQTNFSVALSAQVALQRRLESIANNVANAGTVGFRAEEVKFETMLSRAGLDPVSYASPGTPTCPGKAANSSRPTTRSM